MVAGDDRDVRGDSRPERWTKCYTLNQPVMKVSLRAGTRVVTVIEHALVQLWASDGSSSNEHDTDMNDLRSARKMYDANTNALAPNCRAASRAQPILEPEKKTISLRT